MQRTQKLLMRPAERAKALSFDGVCVCVCVLYGRRRMAKQSHAPAVFFISISLMEISDSAHVCVLGLAFCAFLAVACWVLCFRRNAFSEILLIILAGEKTHSAPPNHLATGKNNAAK